MESVVTRTEKVRPNSTTEAAVFKRGNRKKPFQQDRTAAKKATKWAKEGKRQQARRQQKRGGPQKG